MEALRDLTMRLGHEDVSTYIQSGNLIFSSDNSDSSVVGFELERSIEANLRITVTVIMRSKEEMRAVTTANPVTAEPPAEEFWDGMRLLTGQDMGNVAASAARDPRFLHVTFLAAPPTGQELMGGEVSGLRAAAGPGGQVFGAMTPDFFHVDDQAVYLYCPDGYGRSKLNNAFWERQLGIRATTRNWNSVRKLSELLAASQ